MIATRPDWCISRQRAWGVPIIVFKCGDCGKHVLTEAMAKRVVEAFNNRGADAWFEMSPAELLGDQARCPHCGGENLSKENDILDVWFDSGVSQAAVLPTREELRWPSDLYLEGSDQHRGWFHSSLLCAVGTKGGPPYKAVLTHGFVVDGEGRKMSKSLGNVIPPQDVIKRYGAEILRLWVAAEDYTDDIRLSNEILSQLAEAYRRIRNTMRFMLGNLSDFDPAKDMVKLEDMGELERFMLQRLNALITTLRSAYERFAFHRVYHELHTFCVVDLSGFYLDVLKDRLYTFHPSDPARRAAQSVIWRLADAMVRLMAPILSFTAEEIWDHLPGAKDIAPSVHLAPFPEPEPTLAQPELAEKWQRLMGVRKAVNTAMDVARKAKIVGNSLEATAEVWAPQDSGLHKLISDNLDSLKEITIVSEFKLVDDIPEPMAEGEEGLKVRIVPNPHPKCARCWMQLPTVGSDPDYPDVCHRCAGVLRRLESK